MYIEYRAFTSLPASRSINHVIKIYISIYLKEIRVNLSAKTTSVHPRKPTLTSTVKCNRK